jgi:FkbM family methyltransferase
MLIKLDYLLNKYKIRLTGVLHVGAHECEEINDYEKYLSRDHILWVEAMHDKVILNKRKFNNILIEQAIVLDEEIDVEFKRSNNGESSSILDLGLHMRHYPSITFIDSFVEKSKLLKNIIPNYNIKFNFVNLDIQGAELKALIGMGDYLNDIDYIYTEVNNDYVYKNCALITDIDNYLKKFNFIRVETKMTPYNWGDAFYIRVDKLSFSNISNLILNNCDSNTNGEKLLYDLIRNKVNIIFDVGCRCDSLFTDFNGIVHYFEPDSKSITKLRMQDNKNKLSCFNDFGLSSNNSLMKYYCDSQSFHNRNLGKLYKHDYATNIVLFKVVKASTYIENNNMADVIIDFVKIDTEGHEFDVIKGFEHYIQNVKLLQFEYGGTFRELNIKLSDVINYLKLNNFGDFAYLTSYGVYMIDSLEDHYQYCNIICFNQKFGSLKDIL